MDVDLMLLAMLALTTASALLAFSRWLDASLVMRRCVICPSRGAHADVDFVVDASTPDVYRDVLTCSLLASGEPVRCAKTCRPVAVTPFAAIGARVP